MKFKNKTTGLTWHITDKAHQSRLQSDTGYSIVIDTNTQEETVTPHIEPTIDSITEKVDFKSLEWQELRTIAIEKGINIHGKKRKQIEKELIEMGGVNVTK